MLLKSEIVKLLKNKLFLFTIGIVILIYVIQVNWAYNNLFIPEYEFIFTLYEKMGYNLSDLVLSETISDVLDYGHIVCLKTCFLYPIYWFGKTFILLLIPMTCISCYMDQKSRIYRLHLVYYNQYKYFAHKAMAMSVIFTGTFFLLGIITFVEVWLIQRVNYADNVLREVLYIISSNCSWWSIISFFESLIIIFLVAVCFSFLIYGLFWVTDIPFVGLLSVIVALPDMVGKNPYMLINSMSYQYKCMLPFEEMCLCNNSLVEGASGTMEVVAFYIWNFILIIIGLLSLYIHQRKSE